MYFGYNLIRFIFKRIIRCSDLFLSYCLWQNGFIDSQNRWIFKQIIIHMQHRDYDIRYEGNKDSVVGIGNSDRAVRGVTSLKRWNCSWNLSNEQKEEYFRLEETVCAEKAGKSEECLGNKMLAWLMRNEPNSQDFEMRVQVDKIQIRQSVNTVV